MSQNDIKTTKEKLNEINMIENLIWEIAKISTPNSYIDPKKIQKIRDHVIMSMKEDI